MGRLVALTMLLCPLMLSAAGMMDASSEANVAVIAPAVGMAQPVQPTQQSFVAPRVPADTYKVDKSAKLWRWSAVALAASSGFDAVSSYGKYEGNKFLQSTNGSFGVKGVMIKSSLGLSTIAVEQVLRRRFGHSKAFAIANFIQAGVTASVAARNLGVARMK